MNYSDLITIEPGKRSGKPCIRGLRITVYKILEYWAGGMSEAEILWGFFWVDSGWYQGLSNVCVIGSEDAVTIVQFEEREEESILVLA